MGNAMTWESSDGNFLVQTERHLSFRERVAEKLAPYPAKVIARIAGATPRTAEAWRTGENTPHAEALLKLAAEFDEIWGLVRQQACRDVTDAERMLDQMASVLKQRRGAA